MIFSFASNAIRRHDNIVYEYYGIEYICNTYDNHHMLPVFKS